MLTQVVYLSAVIFGAGIVGGIIVGFLLYPRLFRRGMHRRHLLNFDHDRSKPVALHNAPGGTCPALRCRPEVPDLAVPDRRR